MRRERNANEMWLGVQIRAIAGFELQRNDEKQPRGDARSTPKRRHGRAHGNGRRRVAGRARGKGSVMLESCGLSDGGELEVWRGHRQRILASATDTPVTRLAGSASS